MINEEKLIKKVRAGDDQALEKLFHLYEPLVNSIVKQFYLHHYDRKDWDQEAMIVCYEAALVFSPKKGKFSSLYKIIMHGPWYVTIWHVAGKSIVNRFR